MRVRTRDYTVIIFEHGQTIFELADGLWIKSYFLSISDIVNDEYPMPCSDDDSSDIKVRFFMNLTKSPESD